MAPCAIVLLSFVDWTLRWCCYVAGVRVRERVAAISKLVGHASRTSVRKAGKQHSDVAGLSAWQRLLWSTSVTWHQMTTCMFTMEQCRGNMRWECNWFFTSLTWSVCFTVFGSVHSPLSSPIDHSNTAEILLAWLWLRCVVCIVSCEAFVPFAQELLVEIRRRRSTFDTLENCREFGPVVVEYAKVQSKVNLKYDSWHKDVLSRFGQLIGQVRHVPLACLKYCCSYAVVVGW